MRGSELDWGGYDMLMPKAHAHRCHLQPPIPRALNTSALEMFCVYCKKIFLFMAWWHLFWSAWRLVLRLDCRLVMHTCVPLVRSDQTRPCRDWSVTGSAFRWSPILPCFPTVYASCQAFVKPNTGQIVTVTLLPVDLPVLSQASFLPAERGP